MLGISIETSGKYCSIAVHRENQLLTVQANQVENQHGRDINVLIDAALKVAKVKINDIQYIAVNLGPGSYTSLRIGLATAKGLCYGLDLPLVAMSSFEILSHYAEKQFPQLDHYIPMIDAGRMEVYTAHYARQLECIQEGYPKILDTSAYQELIPDSVCFIGSGVKKWWNLISPSSKWKHLENEIEVNMMVELAYQKWRENLFSNLFQTRPLYIKKPNITTSKKRFFN